MNDQDQKRLNDQFLTWVMNYDVDSVKKLLKEGAHIDAILEEGDGQSPGHDTALHLAARYESVGMVELLLSYEPSLEIRNKSGMTPLLVSAMQSKTPEIAKLLLDKGADVLAADTSGETSLHWAAKNAFRRSVVDHLALAGAKINAQSSSGETPLKAAVRELRVCAVAALLDLGATITEPEDDGSALIDLLEQSESSVIDGWAAEIASLLIVAGADPLPPDANGKTLRDRFPDCQIIHAMVASFEAKKAIRIVLSSQARKAAAPA